MQNCRWPMTPWQCRQRSWMTFSCGACTVRSVSSCEKKIGSRPARPMGEARHSPYGARLTSRPPGLHRHVEAQASGPGGVAPHTLVGREELGWSVGPGHYVIIGLRWHVQGGVGKDVDHWWQRGGAEGL